MRRVTRGAIAIALAVVTAVAGYAVSDAKHADATTTLGPGLVTVRVNIRYSKFSISTLPVRPGTTVRFLVRNNDPIDHEFIVGDARVHALHERGTHPAHPPVPGEVSVAAGQLGWDLASVSPSELASAVDRFRLFDNAIGESDDPLMALVGAYEEQLRRRNALDFPAMLTWPLRLLRGDAQVRRVIQSAFR